MMILKNTYRLKVVVFICLILPSINLTSQLCVGAPGQVKWSYWRAIPDDVIGELHAREFYPESPDGFLVLNSLQSPYRYDNYYGSFIRGYIQVPTSDTVRFNITGDNLADFYLSTDDRVENLQKVAFLTSSTGQDEHDDHPEQTSEVIQLDTGTYYYFEVHHVESGSSDHVSIWWKNSFIGSTEWQVVSTTYLYDVGCTATECDERGSPCDDGDPATIDDQYDGFCNCEGQPATSNSCVGDRFYTTVYYYDSIPGSYLEDLYEAPDFPTLPDWGERLSFLGKYKEYDREEFGSLVQGYITVPVSGNYKFNITGDNQSIFFLSSNDDPANKQAHQVLTDYASDMTEHDEQIFQSTSNIFLQQGDYYYFELNHKQGGGSFHNRIFWQTPYTQEGQWKTIPTFYLYDYDCELACVPQGTPCDDGDPFTNDDQYDDSCNCVGTPCSGPDCDDPIANYVPFDPCGLTGEVDNRSEDFWLSCQTSESINAARGTGHWLLYDLGNLHRLYTSQVWNYNVQGAESNGINMVAIDYSENGVDWVELGQFNWLDAPGSGDYDGFAGPDFSGIRARYILITSLDNQPCAGLSKIAIQARECGAEGSVCDDGNPLTTNDQFDANCNCTGMIENVNNCAVDSLFLGDSLLMLDNYWAIKMLESESTIMQNSQVSFKASESVGLERGFEGQAGGILTIHIENCPAPAIIENPDAFKSLEELGRENPLIVSEMTQENRQLITYYVSEPGQVELTLTDSNGKIVEYLVGHKFRNGGLYRKRINTILLEPGEYLVRLERADEIFIEKMVVRTLGTEETQLKR